MENFDKENSQSSELFITNQANYYLLSTSKWGRFLAIMGFISIGLMFVMGVLMLFEIWGAGEIGSSYYMSQMGIIYFIIAAIYFFPVRYLYIFSNNVKNATSINDVATLESGFKNLKSLFKFMGITTIIMIALYVIMIIGMIIFFSTMKA